MYVMIEDPKRIRLVEWLSTPPTLREPATHEALAVELGIASRTLRMWKKEPQVRAEWEKSAKDYIGDPDKILEVIEEMRRGALDKNESLTARTKAASLYLQVTDSIRPPQLDLASKKAAELSDAELDAMIAEAAQRELVERKERA